MRIKLRVDTFNLFNNKKGIKAMLNRIKNLSGVAATFAILAVSINVLTLTTDVKADQPGEPGMWMPAEPCKGPNEPTAHECYPNGFQCIVGDTGWGFC
ncbi:MAG: hypothetical protein K9J12_17485 [Melioribacteraceae bacterium]|nr:hypothetical protein [Melioribacteraceae bacterium]MCF8262994.1 hypothetical protein [Melioribacteraceae bacterium]MCF8430439.1 hypothetical protein [Melioribacteraceae bacterium]